jgi:hypothetical protein
VAQVINNDISLNGENMVSGSRREKGNVSSDQHVDPYYSEKALRQVH